MARYYFMTEKYAVELVRNPKYPRLVFYENGVWNVRATGDSRSKVDWVLGPRDGQRLGSKTEIDFMFDVSYIKTVRPAAGDDDSAANKGDATNGESSASATKETSNATKETAGLEIMFRNGSVLMFEGGLYLHEPLLEVIIDRLEASGANIDTVKAIQQSKNNSVVQEFAQRVYDDSKNKAVVAGVVGGAATYAWTSGMVYSYGASLVSGYVASHGYASTVAAVNLGLSFTKLGSISAIAQSAAASAGLLGYSPAAVLMLTAKGAVATATGTLAIGVAIGVAVGAGAAVREYYRKNKGADLTASEKIFKKIQCLSGFDKCCSGEVLVPRGHPCPELPGCVAYNWWIW